MREPAATAGLVAPGGSTLRAMPGPRGAVSGTVDLAAIAAAADHAGARQPGTETAAPDRTSCFADRHGHVDERRDCRDIVPACVPQHGVGHGVDAEPPSCARRRACHLSCGPNTVGASRLSPPRPLSTDAHERSDAAPAADHPRTSCKVETSPDLRGFRTPSTLAAVERRYGVNGRGGKPRTVDAFRSLCRYAPIACTVVVNPTARFRSIVITDSVGS